MEETATTCRRPELHIEGECERCEVDRLRDDRDLVVRALREYAADRSDEDIAFDFDAPGARLHERLKRILSEVPNGRCERCNGREVLTRSGRDSVTGEDADEDWPCDLCHPEQYGSPTPLLCRFCDGTGWNEGTPATTCSDCAGSGLANGRRDT